MSLRPFRTHLPFIISCFLLSVAAFSFADTTPPPAAFAGLIADIKYSQDEGLKICEIQPISHSRFRGSDFAHEDMAYVASQFVPLVSDLFQNTFFRIKSMCEPAIREGFGDLPNCFGFESMLDMEKDNFFRIRASEAPEDPSDLASYPAMVYVRRNSIADKRLFLKKYPGALLMDQGVWEPTLNKRRLNELFASDEYLSQFRPRWDNYPKKYSKELVKKIKAEINSDIYVVKPIAGTKGHGIIVCSEKALEKVLKRILKRDLSLRNHPDPSYRYWYYDKSKHFIVEQYATSDAVHPEHLEKAPYDGTLRAVFTLAYSQGEVEFQLLDSYWKLPSTALDAKKASLTDMHKSCGKEPYFAEVDADIEAEVEAILMDVMPHMYRVMLGLELEEEQAAQAGSEAQAA